MAHPCVPWFNRRMRNTGLDFILADHRLSSRDLALRVGRSRQTIARWRSGATRPSRPDILALSRALDVPVERLTAQIFVAVVEDAP